MLTPRSRRTTDLLLHACYAKSSRSRDRDLIKHPTPKIPKLTRKFSEDDMNVFPSSTRLWYVVKCRVILVDGARQHSDALHVAQVRQPFVYFADMVWRTDCNTMSACCWSLGESVSTSSCSKGADPKNAVTSGLEVMALGDTPNRVFGKVSSHFSTSFGVPVKQCQY